jgi:hypothetical protein
VEVLTPEVARCDNHEGDSTRLLRLTRDCWHTRKGTGARGARSVGRRLCIIVYPQSFPTLAVPRARDSPTGEQDPIRKPKRGKGDWRLRFQAGRLSRFRCETRHAMRRGTAWTAQPLILSRGTPRAVLLIRPHASDAFAKTRALALQRGFHLRVPHNFKVIDSLIDSNVCLSLEAEV